ncbi:MAG: acetyl-CoA carboxylase carboxyltransferase subunit beta [Alphaproteobacteria bacterium]|nr:acetyl-CoA carboxylase carboxyltransferase subunit beta [Alphaproteobacteria bacterium]
MNWLTNFVRPRIRALVSKTEVPENLWEKCPGCEQMLFHRELEANLRVCQHCNYHMRIGAAKRLDMLFDDATYALIEMPKVEPDPLKFRDRRRYSERLKDAQAKTGHSDALIAAQGTIGGIQSVLAVLNFEFLGGSMGLAVGEGLLTAARQAVALKAPFIVISASGGARMQEGILSLMQMPRTVIAVNQVRDADLPYIVILADPTTGGVSASFAMLGDITIAEPGAVVGFAGSRVIEETIREKLPDGFQRAEYLLDHGIVDMVVDRHKMRDTMIRLLGFLTPQDIIALPAMKSERKTKPDAKLEPRAADTAIASEPEGEES